MGVPERSKAATLLILLCVSIPSFMLSLDANIVALPLPSISHLLNANSSGDDRGEFSPKDWR